ncbi:hypothetical protein V8G54_033998 [Vigna mungo]|uniref:Uncharacterized protein n=1 Tax=Vigna mungo TaxID=3915 RepID=A0AAQ3MPX8_VIGMU
MACEKEKSGEKRKNLGMFTQTEIEMARQLVQLSNSITDSSSTDLQEDGRSLNSSESVEGKWKKSNDEDISDAVEDVLAEIEEDESLRRRNNRYRYIQDLYNSTRSTEEKCT